MGLAQSRLHGVNDLPREECGNDGRLCFASALSDERLEIVAMTWEDWRHLTIEEYRTLFKGSAVKRAKYEGLKRNIEAIDPNLKSKH